MCHSMNTIHRMSHFPIWPGEVLTKYIVSFSHQLFRGGRQLFRLLAFCGLHDQFVHTVQTDFNLTVSCQSAKPPNYKFHTNFSIHRVHTHTCSYAKHLHKFTYPVVVACSFEEPSPARGVLTGSQYCWSASAVTGRALCPHFQTPGWNASASPHGLRDTPHTKKGEEKITLTCYRVNLVYLYTNFSMCIRKI